MHRASSRSDDRSLHRSGAIVIERDVITLVQDLINSPQSAVATPTEQRITARAELDARTIEPDDEEP